MLTKLLMSAEVMGSRGRARHYGRSEPIDSDYDFVIFTDDRFEQITFMSMMRHIAATVPVFSLIKREGGFLTISSDHVDISVYPLSKRQEIHAAWALQESGLTKDEAWQKVNESKN